MSVSERIAFDDRVDQSARIIMTPSLILIWSFADPIHPQVSMVLLHRNNIRLVKHDVHLNMSQEPDIVPTSLIPVVSVVSPVPSILNRYFPFAAFIRSTR